MIITPADGTCLENVYRYLLLLENNAFGIQYLNDCEKIQDSFEVPLAKTMILLWNIKRITKSKSFSEICHDHCEENIIDFINGNRFFMPSPGCPG